MSLARQVYLSPAYERLKAMYEDAKRVSITDNSAGYSAGLRDAIRVLEEESAMEQPSYLRRPSKPTYSFDTDGQSD